MSNRVTMQDIADALQLSRNTVSKAINNTGVLAESTRERVLKKAIEMGYKQFSYLNMAAAGIKDSSLTIPQEVRELALFTTSFPGNSHFASTLLDKFQRETSQLGYNTAIYCIREEELRALQLPLQFDKERISGILCVEMFDYEYGRMLCDLDIPILFVDSPVAGRRPRLKADILLMDNLYSVFSMISELVRRGKKKFGFIGDFLHCQSFLERYMAFRNALYVNGIAFEKEFCLTEQVKGNPNPSFDDCREYLEENLKKMPALPEVFFCCNDFAAIDALNILRCMDVSVPGDICLCGFDDSPESRVMVPSLTTIHIHSQIMGLSAVYLLMSRIEEPSMQFRTLHTETDVIYRESTGD